MGCGSSTPTWQTDPLDPHHRHHHNHQHSNHEDTSAGGHARYGGGGTTQRHSFTNTTTGYYSATEASTGWRVAGIRPLMGPEERSRVLEAYTSTLRGSSSIFSTVSFIKHAMRIRIDGARKRVEERRQRLLHERSNPQHTSDTTYDSAAAASSIAATLRSLQRPSNNKSSIAPSHSRSPRQTRASPQPQPSDRTNTSSPQTHIVLDVGGAPLLRQHTKEYLVSPNDSGGGADNSSMEIGDDESPSCAARTVDGNITPTKEQRGEQRLSGSQLVVDRLSFLKLCQLTMPDDGNGQFRAIALQVFGDGSCHRDVRTMITSAMKRSKENYEFMFRSVKACDEYLLAMSCEGVIGDEQTLRAACDVFGIVIHVLMPQVEEYYAKYVPNVAALDPEDHFDTLDVFLSFMEPATYGSVRHIDEGY